MRRYLIAYIVTAVVFLGVHFVYLSLAGGPMYRQALGDHLPGPLRSSMLRALSSKRVFADVMV